MKLLYNVTCRGISSIYLLNDTLNRKVLEWVVTILAIIMIVFVIFVIFRLMVDNKLGDIKKYCDKVGIQMEDVHHYDELKIIDGLHVPLHTKCHLLFHKDAIYIIHEKGVFVMDKIQLIGAHKMTNKEIIETQNNHKSLIGRSLIGGVVFGGTGAVIGAISATTGPKQQTAMKEEHFLVITYMNNANVFSTLIFSEAFVSITDCIDAVNNKISITNSDTVTYL